MGSFVTPIYTSGETHYGQLCDSNIIILLGTHIIWGAFVTPEYILLGKHNIMAGSFNLC